MAVDAEVRPLRQFRLPVSIREPAYAEVWRRVKQAVDAYSDRDDEIADLRDQLDGVAPPPSPISGSPTGEGGPWRNSCKLVDPLTDEHHTSQLSFMISALRAEPYWLVESQEAEDESSASLVEIGLTAKAREWKLPARLYDAASDALAFPFSVISATWRDATVNRRFEGWEDPDTGAILTDDELVEGVTYRPRHATETLVSKSGVELRSVDPSNFGVWPPDAEDIEKAELVWERQFLTEGELMAGVEDPEQMFDEEAVYTKLKAGPRWVNADSQDENDRDGIQSTEGFYEVYQVIGRLPLLVDEEGKPKTPAHLRNEDWVFLIDADTGKCLRAAPYPYTIRNYVLFHTHRRPRRMGGRSVVGRLKNLQAEANVNLRYYVDTANLDAMPIVLKPQTMKNYQYRLQPGAQWAYDPKLGAAPSVIRWDMMGAQLLGQVQGDLRSTASRLVSAEGINSNLGGKVRKAAEVEFAGSTISLKAGLYLGCFQEGMERLGILLVALYSAHMGDQETITDAVLGKTVVLTAEDLQKRYRFVPHANTDAANPELRIKQTMIRQQAMLGYIQGTMQFGPQWWPQLYHSARRTIEETGERNPEAWLGKEPQVGDPAQVLQQVTSALQAAAQGGDQIAAQILQGIMGAMQGGGQQQGMPPPQQAPPQLQGMVGQNGNGNQPQQGAAVGAAGGPK